MTGSVHVLLPPTSSHLAPPVLEAGCVPIIDATGSNPPHVPDGAWVRTRPGRPAPGSGPVVLAELGAPVPDRPTWLETSAARNVPSGFVGLVLKGREAGGYGSEEDGLVALSRCPEPGRVLLDAGCGPRTAAAAAALGAAGVWLAETHLGCPELALPPHLKRRLQLADDEVTQLVGGIRVANPPTAPVLRELARSGDLWSLADGLWDDGDLQNRLWMAGQGLAIARELAARHGSLQALLAAYVRSWRRWHDAARTAAPGTGRPVGRAIDLVSGTAAGVGGPVGASVLWEEAGFVGLPVHGGPLRAALATGQPVVADADEIAEEQRDLPPPPTPAAATTAASVAPPARAEAPSPEAVPAVAIIGIGCHFPDAPGREAFWSNVVGGHSAIREVPKERWDPALFYDADPDVADKSYTAIGAFIRDFEFQPKRFRIPPKVASSIDPVQQLTLHCVAEALDDAGLKVDKRHDGREFDRERCAVILGNSLGGEVTDHYAVRLAWPEVARKLVAVPPFCNMNDAERADFLTQMEEAYKAGLPVINEDSMPGELANVIAGRIANAFDLGGANFTVDAACASSMAALQSAVKTLTDGDADLVLTGGADRSMNITTYVKFCKIGALSPDHSSPFDASANGFVMGEGCGIMVLKRLEDAERDGDRVYAVIRGIGASSDGKGKGITAPNIQGQLRALRRAYEAAGIEPHEVDLIEAHGTSTVVGDKVEMEALSQMIGGGHRGDRGPVRVGSVKSMIGHLKSAAGAASCIKAAMALHHGILPPSLGFQKARKDVPMDVVPLQVQTTAEAWPETPSGLRRAGVSAFGFGGTNFHIVMESWAGQPLPRSVPKAPPVPQRSPVRAPSPAPRVLPVPAEARSAEVPEGLWAASGRTHEELLGHLEALVAGQTPPFHPSAPFRMAAAARDEEDRQGQLARAIKTLKKGSNPDLLRARAIHFEDAPFDGKLALMFTGQGSQYLDMGLDLAEAYPIVRQTFEEADRILTPTLGKGITDYIRLLPGEDKDAKSDLLRQTEYSQPATLTLDVAILRLLAAYGVSADVVAGHSLGEYGAAVASGVMTFEQALLAVSARGREMANIRLDDPGKMAGIAASTQVVEEILAEVDGYVIAANKNCPSQTVIAGASDAVDEASERFKARGITVYPLPVSHAFHSAIVQPASEPLRGVLDRLGLQAPKKPITTNVTGDYYPSGPNAVPAIIDLLAQQISAPVEWVAQLERMYDDGARVFVECGPKRALSGFTVAILKRRPHRALYTNHPKRGGVASFRDALAGLLAVGLPVRAQPVGLDQIDLFAPPMARKATSTALAAWSELQASEAIPELEEGIRRIVAQATGYAPSELDMDFELEADLGIDTVKQAEIFGVVRDTYGIPADPGFSFSDHRTLRKLVQWAAAATGATRPAVPASVVETPLPPARSERIAPPTSPAIDADVVTTFLERAAKAGMDDLDASAFAEALLPAVEGLLSAAFQASQQARPAPAIPAAPAVSAPSRPLPGKPFAPDLHARVVATGASLGLPGGDEVFGKDNLLSLLRGDNRIDHIQQRAERFLEMGLVRLVKDPTTGQGSFLPVTELDQVVRLAGIAGAFDLTDWGVDANLQRALDITTAYAFAAGLEALRDAGLPLVRTYKETASGKQVPKGWQLAEPLRDGTGVIFASAFPGYDQLVRKLAVNGDDGEGHFDRRFLFQVLAMGHSQFAQLLGVRGPNTSVNAACASTTQAVELADDWIRLGRCERVIVISADDVTSENLLPWIGGGFMAAGAATTTDVVEEAALPFDARRHGMILGMGAAAIVLERADVAEARGVVPIAEHLGGVVVNSAFHGTRLDVGHISQIASNLVRSVAEAEGTTPEDMAEHTFFMSHETYTPARGGSAAAEIQALRDAFGTRADDVTIANTKGYTGHAMGAGIEDTTALKALQYGIVPPVANLKVPDPDLGPLKLSRGEQGDYRYAVRLAAGFGSQLAMSVWKAIARGDDRVADAARRTAWLRRITGYDHVEEVVEQRTLRAQPASADRLLPIVPDVSPQQLRDASPKAPAPTAPIPTPPPVRAPEAPPAPIAAAPAASTAAPAGYDAMLGLLTDVIAEKTGYDPDELESDFELEADLGIDTVKQAEIMGELTERFGMERDEEFRMADYPTIEALAGYLSGAVGAEPSAEPAPAEPAPAPPAPAEPGPPPVQELADLPETPMITADGELNAATLAASLGDLLDVVAEKTGYAPDELEPDFELEADLGIDTVKQAEIMGELTERYGLDQDESFRLADYPTLEALAAYLAGRRAGFQSASATPPGVPRPPVPAQTPAPAQPRPETDHDVAEEEPVAPEPRAVAAPAVDGPPLADTLQELIALVADRTGYDVSDLEPDFELEADLGIDTVKQAEILGELRDRYALPEATDFAPAEHPTLEALGRWVHGRRLATLTGASEPPAVDEVPDDTPEEASLDDALLDAPMPASARKAEPAPSQDARVELPSTFRLRRPILVKSPSEATPLDPQGLRVQVLGEGPIASALRQEASVRGALADGPFDVVIDAGYDVLSVFHRARQLDGERPAHWVAVTRLGGLESGDWLLEHGLSDGSRAGFTKALGREWSETHAKVIDAHPDLAPAEVAQCVFEELGVDQVAEVFFAGDGTRRTVAFESVPRPEGCAPLGENPVVVITGGARGIGSVVAKEIARRGRVQLALVGRSPVPEEPLDEAAAKARIKEDLKARGERVTPAKVSAAMAPMIKAEEARRTLEELRGLGADVSYLQADVSRPEYCRRLLSEVYQELGPVDVLIHGAGVEESRLIADKDDAAFHRVYDGKALGGRALIEAVPSTAFVVSMGSVAGRFGNPGQVDYAAANDGLARVCQARPRALHVDWTAWGDVGMAVRGGMQRLLEERGVDLLPATAGAQTLVDLIAAGIRGELVIAGRLGDFEPGGPSHPLLDRVERSGDTVRAFRELTKAGDPWILDHAIDGVPVLPGVIGLEMMAGTAQELFPNQAFTGARNVQFTAPVKLHKDNPTSLILEAEPGRDGEARCRLVSERILRTGRTRRTEHFSATLCFAPTEAMDSLPSAFLPDEEVTPEGIYQRFFHGPQFQVLTGVFGAARDGLIAEGKVDHGGIADGLLTAPLALEAAFQAAGLHRMMVAHQMGLPLEIEELQLMGTPSDGEGLSLLVQYDESSYHVDVDGLEGPLLRVRGFRMIDRGPVPPGDRFPEPDGGRPVCFPARPLRRLATRTATAEARDDDEPKAWLVDDELSELEARGTARRVRDRVAGRIAAKRALHQLTGVDPLEMRIHSATSGEPVAEVPGHPAVRVSVSHRAGHAVAVAVSLGRVGVDLERVETRPESFARTWFDADERTLVGADPLRQTIAWCTKEAVLKALGTGMALSPHAVRVVAIEADRVMLRLTGEAAERHSALGGGTLEARWTSVPDDEVRVTVRMAA